jgi:hypothetical protein
MFKVTIGYLKLLLLLFEQIKNNLQYPQNIYSLETLSEIN